MGIPQKLVEMIRDDGWIGLTRGGAMAAARRVMDLNLKRRAAVGSMLRKLPGTSESFGPPRRPVSLLRETILRADHPQLLLDAQEDAFAKIHDSEAMNFRPPKTLPDRPDPLTHLSGRHIQPEVFLFSLRDARVIGADGTVVTQRDELFGEGSPWGLQELIERPTHRWIVAPPVLDLEGTHIHACGRWNQNYYHWLFDIVTRLLPLLRYPELTSLPILVPANIRPIQVEVLNKLGFTGRIVPQPGPHVRIERLLYSSPVRVTHCPPKWALMEMRWAVKLRTDHKPSRKIYITRNDAKYRRVTNENEVMDYLRPLGYESVRLTGMTFQQQIDLFNQASHVIGANGSSFTNLAFGLSGTRVLELFAPQYVHAAQYALADILDMDYWFLVGASDGVLDLKVSIDDIRQIVEKWR
jgi:capsular polysaccharide biosynthesis protein